MSILLFIIGTALVGAWSFATIFQSILDGDFFLLYL